MNILNISLAVLLSLEIIVMAWSLNEAKIISDQVHEDVRRVELTIQNFSRNLSPTIKGFIFK